MQVTNSQITENCNKPYCDPMHKIYLLVYKIKHVCTDRKEADFKKPASSTTITFITLVAHAVTLTHFLLSVSLHIQHVRNWNVCMCVCGGEICMGKWKQMRRETSENGCGSVFKFVGECKCKLMSLGKRQSRKSNQRHIHSY